MIGRLRGKLLRKEPPSLLLDVGGVGYELEAPMTTFYDLPPVGENVVLHTHMVVREDAQLLYGFSRETQRRLFRSLLKVSGIGPRMALAILSGLSEDEFMRCVSNEDIMRLSQAPGVGRKTAERLVVEMRDKAFAGSGADPTDGIEVAFTAPQDPVSEAVSALIALGYKPNEASRAVRGVPSNGLSTEEIIRQALKRVAG
ncbi:MAG: Holliday junction branch migration protein RuvA [Acidiferrobacterales bacterium]